MDKPKTLGEHFDRMVTLHESAGPSTSASTTRRLRLKREPCRRLLAGLPRQMGKVEPSLIAVLRSLVVGDSPWPLLIYGGVGAGKTLAALSLADFCDTACYSTLDGLCDQVVGGEWHHVADWDCISKKELAILDEIGERSKVADLLRTTLKRYLDEREQQAGSTGIYISNCTPKQLANLFDDRIVSRLLAGTVHYIDSPDRRSQ